MMLKNHDKKLSNSKAFARELLDDLLRLNITVDHAGATEYLKNYV